MIGIRVLFILFFVAAAYAESIPLDRVLAVVNDDIITMQELKEQVGVTRARMRQQGTPMPDENLLQQKVLEKLVFEKLQVQSAKEAGVVISEDMIDQALNNVAQRNNLSIDQVLGKLKDEGVNEKVFRQNLKDQLAVQAIIDRDVKGKISVSDSEVDAMLERLGQTGQSDRTYKLSHILISTPDDATQDDIRAAIARAEALLIQIRTGDLSFGEAAVRYSDAQDGIDGGGLGWKTPDQLPAIFTEALGPMEKGDISPILRSPNGIHILFLEDIKGADVDMHMAIQTSARHILIMAKTPVEVRAAQERLVEMRTEILAGKDFAELALANSEDPGSAAKGGELGWMNKGETVPAFEQTMDRLEPGELSQPVVSQFGVHLIQLNERREIDVSDKLRREKVRTQIANRKSEERYEQWLRELKAKAYIDYRIPLEEL